MRLLESIKGAGLRVVDALDKLHDGPYESFSRPTLPKQSRKLYAMEADFYQAMMSRFWVCDGQVIAHRIPLPEGSPIDTGDQAIWHGIYVGALALRYSVITDPIQQANTYSHLVDAAGGLQLHQTIHGESSPRLIRGVANDLKSWQDDASNDSASGHLFGIYALWKWGPPSLQPVSVQLITGLAAELLAHNNALVRADGTPTSYGALELGWKTDPLRITLALAIYATAATITKQPAFMQAYSDLYARYEPILEYPKVRFWWVDKFPDTHRAAIHLAILADLTMHVPHQTYLCGLERIRRMTAKEGNVWVNALCQFGGYGWAPDNRDLALKVLSEFDECMEFDNAVDHVKNPIVNDYKFSIKWWNDQYVSTQPLPAWAKGAQDFIWQRHPYSVEDWLDHKAPTQRLNCYGAFEAAYWLSRATGILNADD